MYEIVASSENMDESGEQFVPLDSLDEGENEVFILPPVSKSMEIFAIISFVLAALALVLVVIAYTPIIFSFSIEYSSIIIFDSLSIVAIALGPVALIVGIIAYRKLPKGSKIRKIATAGITVSYISLVIEITSALFFIVFFRLWEKSCVQ